MRSRNAEIGDVYHGCEVDHVRSVKHGGLTLEDNMALACFHCNRHKGTDLGSVSVRTETLVRFYNPRTDHWKEHFCWSEARIEPLTDIGEVTARLLEFNHPESVVRVKPACRGKGQSLAGRTVPLWPVRPEWAPQLWHSLSATRWTWISFPFSLLVR
jgi:HNH endonuclease